MIRVSILGATGYSGGELVRLLLGRKDVKIQHVTSESSVGKPLHYSHPSLKDRSSLVFEPLKTEKIFSDTDVVFSCLPASIGIKPNSVFIKKGLKVIDFSGDFRLPTAQLYRTWYKETHAAPGLLGKAVYGLPEIFREKIKHANLIANPGCYATAAVLAAAPFLSPLLIDPVSLIVDAKSGVSGAGKKVASQYLYCEVNENLMPYSIATHRHQPEIEHALKTSTRIQTRVTFTPHLVPMNRGILSVLYATLKKATSLKALRAHLEDFYKDEPFIRVLPEGEWPQTKNVTNTNFCDLGITVDSRSKRLIVVSALDNLMKGAASQAVQNMNLCFNLPETEGLL